MKAAHSSELHLHQKLNNIKASALRVVQQQMLKTCDKLEMTLHVDVWADPWQRHWLGAIAECFDETRHRQSRLVGFEDLDTWAESLKRLSTPSTNSRNKLAVFVREHC